MSPFKLGRENGQTGWNDNNSWSRQNDHGDSGQQNDSADNSDQSLLRDGPHANKLLSFLIIR